MFNAANQTAILVPMLVVVALTFVGFIRMLVGRAAAIPTMNPDFYRAYQGGTEPMATAVAVRHYGNLTELPTLFYAGAITAYALQAVGQWTLILAWVFVALRLVQSAVHLTYNRPAHRGMAFVFSALALFALWVNVGLVIAARL